MNQAKNNGCTPLYIAAENGHLEIAKLLLVKGKANVNLARDMGATPLFVAAYRGHVEVAKLLLVEGKASVINSPLLNFEVSQSGFGMYVKYLMAGFLAVFAVTMMVQFAGYLLDAVADQRNEPGKRKVADAGAH